MDWVDYQSLTTLLNSLIIQYESVMTPNVGLEEVWISTQETLAQIIPFYEKGNRIISFGFDSRLRRDGIVKTVKSGDAVLDIGCGPGTMSQSLSRYIGDVELMVLGDPLIPMLEAAKRSALNVNLHINCVFEYLPFKEEAFDVVMCGFSFRDARNYKEALGEFQRVLKNNGRLLIVDIGKSDNFLIRWFVGLYFRFIAGALIWIFLGVKKRSLYSKIYYTYRKYLTFNQLENLLKAQFKEVKIQQKMLGAAMIAVAKKQKTG